MGVVTGGKVLFVEPIDQEADKQHEDEGGDGIDYGIQFEMFGQRQQNQPDGQALEQPL